MTFLFNENADLLFIFMELNEKFQRLTWLNTFVVQPVKCGACEKFVSFFPPPMFKWVLRAGKSSACLAFHLFLGLW